MNLFRLSDIGVRFESGSGPFYPIRHINVSFPRKGLVAIKGKSGSGKSTLLNVISSLLKPSEGKVLFQGKPISKWSEKKLSLWRLHHIGIVFQHYNLIENMTAQDNVALPLLMSGVSKRKARAKAKELLLRFGIGDLADKNVSKFSGGERQRVAILRALANDPDIVLADEPTGALDTANGSLVMQMLKDISKEKLVIYVSHNEEMISFYSDFTFAISEGHLLEEKKKEEENDIDDGISTKKQYARKWPRIFTARNFTHHKAKNLICFISGLIGYSSLLLASGFYFGSSKCIENEQTRSLEYMTATVSEKTYIDIENSPLRMVRRKRPTFESAKDAVEGIDNVLVEPDYSFFLPQYSSFELDGEKQEGCSFYPCFDITLKGYDADFLARGEAPNGSSFEEVLVNEEFCASFGDCLGENITLSSTYSFSYENETIEGELRYSFFVKGVVSEFSFLNSPKVYYSYFGLDALLSSTPSAVGKTLKDIVVDGDDGESFTSLDYYLFAKAKKAVPSLEKRLEELKEKGSFLSIESSCYEVKNAFTSLTDAFSMALLIFVGIAVVGIAVIEGMIGYSNFISQKKEAGILLSLGARKEEINSIFVNESVSVSLFSGIVSFLLCPFFQRGLNIYIEGRFSLSNLIDIPFSSLLGIPGFLFIILALFSMLVAYLGTSIAVSGIKSNSLSLELKDE